MKRHFVLLSLAGFLAMQLHAQSTASPQPNAEELKALRQLLAEQKNNPGKVIRTPASTAAAQPQPAPSPVAQPTASAAEAELPVFKPDPPRTEPLSTKAAAAAALERQYLDGKLSERQYKKALADLERANKADTKMPPPPAKPAVRRQPPSDAPAVPAANPKTVKQQKVSEVENKLDEMIRQKEARERAAKTNATPVAMPAGTKRERLDFLLKQVIEGKISDEEYKKQREKILAEP